MFIRREHLFAVVTGLMDGILTALTLASGKIMETQAPLNVALALRISAGAAVSGVCIFFVAEYSRLRREMVNAERHLSLRSHGQLAVSQLGRGAVRQAAGRAVLSGFFSFIGALFPLAPAALRPGQPWLALVAALCALAALGVSLARVIYGRPAIWATALVGAGIVMAIVGITLHIV